MEDVADDLLFGDGETHPVPVALLAQVGVRSDTLEPIVKATLAFEVGGQRREVSFVMEPGAARDGAFALLGAVSASSVNPFGDLAPPDETTTLLDLAAQMAGPDGLDDGPAGRQSVKDALNGVAYALGGFTSGGEGLSRWAADLLAVIDLAGRALRTWSNEQGMTLPEAVQRLRENG